MSIKKSLLGAIISCLLVGADCGEVVPQEGAIKIDPKTKFQTIDGWAAHMESGHLYGAGWDNYKDDVYDIIVNDLGITRFRLEVRAGAESAVDSWTKRFVTSEITPAEWRAIRYASTNDDADPDKINASGFQWSEIDDWVNIALLPLKKRVEANGESAWINVCYVNFGKGQGETAFKHKEHPDEYAEFVLATYQHLESTFGFVPNSWEIILEPDNAGTSWSATQVANAIKAAGDKLAANGYTPYFVAPSTTKAQNASAYIDKIAATTGAMQYLREFSYHRYGGSPPPTSAIQDIADRAATHSKRTSQLEWIGADHHTLFEDLTVGQNSAWQQFIIANPIAAGDGGGAYLIADNTDPANPVVTLGSRTKFLRQYFKYIRPGAQRIGAESQNASFGPVAFVNPDGSHILVVKTQSPATIKVEGMPEGVYGITYTTSRGAGVQGPQVKVVAGKSTEISIPSAGVVTVFEIEDLAGSTPK